jgi:hypothetical protein
MTRLFSIKPSLTLNAARVGGFALGQASTQGGMPGIASSGRHRDHPRSQGRDKLTAGCKP